MNLAGFLELAHLDETRLAEAEQLLTLLVTDDSEPADTTTWLLLAECQLALGKTDAAIQTCRQVMSLFCDDISLYGPMSDMLIRTKQLNLALSILNDAIDAFPDKAELFFYRSNVRIQMNQLKLALADCEQASTLAPEMIEAVVNKGWLLQNEGRFEEALAVYEKIETRPDLPPTALLNISGLYLLLGQYEAASAVLERLMQLAPELPALYVNLGMLCVSVGKADQALQYFERAIALDSGQVKAHWNRAHIQLKQGDFSNGLPGLSWRFKLNESLFIQLPKPQWQGESLTGKTILVLAEGGYGDSFQFYRYLFWLKEQAERVIFCCQPATTTLYHQCAGYDQLIETGQPLPEYDYYVHLMSLPELAGTRLESIPAPIPYLQAEQKLLATWQEFFNAFAGLKIGLVWAGSDVNNSGFARSCPLQELAPLSAFSEMTFFSLQKGRHELSDQAANSSFSGFPLTGFSLIDLKTHLTDFHQTAAIICNLDLLITVDTAVAHLAGALGKPVWVLLNYASDWRWLENRSDSPWYPGVRLFRQPRPGDWPSVIAAVCEALKGL